MYINLLIGVSFGLLFFLCALKAYTKGIEHGKQLSQGNVPKVNLNPVKPIVDVIKTKQEESKLTEGLNDIMSVTKESMIETIKRGEA